MGSSFLFDASVTGPAIDHFQQVPALFWGFIGATIFVSEASRVQLAWQNPFQARPDHAMAARMLELTASHLTDSASHLTVTHT